jgi:toxin ParE1/3/4
VSRRNLTRRAHSDLAEITLYTTDAWGDAQAERYFSLLLNGCDLVAEKPGLGRACDSLGVGLRRFEVGKHVIFYKPDRHGVLISRILHQSMLPTRPNFMDA